MHFRIHLTSAVVAAAALGGCTKAPPAPPLLDVAVATETRVAPDAITESSVVETAASIVALDERARLATLRLPDGRLQTVRIDPAVGSLRKVRLGDEVVVTYYEQIAVDVRTGGGSPGVAEDAEVATAAPGTRPGGVAAETTTVSAAVASVDRKHHRLTLRGPDGRVTTVDVHDPTRLAAVQVGDLVELSVTDALAVQIEKAPKR
jgi:hypothetical protein